MIPQNAGMLTISTRQDAGPDLRTTQLLPAVAAQHRQRLTACGQKQLVALKLLSSAASELTVLTMPQA